MALLKWSIFSLTAILQLVLIKQAFCQGLRYPTDDSDLATIISRPDLKPPLFNVTNFDPGRVSPGYWFLAPYGGLQDTSLRTAQVGPHIFDNQGNLIWSGASIFDSNTTLDFRVTSYNGSPHLSFLIQRQFSDSTPRFRIREGLILDESYTIRAKVREDLKDSNIDMHEFNVINQGQSSLLIYDGPDISSITHCNTNCSKEIPMKSNLQIGFQEVDINSGQILFDWRIRDHVQPEESTVNIKHSAADFFHMNSVDKNLEGDFLVSSRNTNCIYKVSGIDGSIIWRLGGKNSSFILDGFNFSSQHDARFREENTTTTIISFLNNASDGARTTSNHSFAIFVALHTSTSPMRASLIARYDRPDGQLTKMRGNVQALPNTNIVVGWSAGGYVSEFTADGKCILEAGFTSLRFASYRAYKFNFTATPTELPSLKAYAFGELPADASTTYYASWNGATEIAFWNFYASYDSSSELVIVGKVAKSNFETMFTVAGHVSYVMAEAVAEDGRILGHSMTEKTILAIDSNFTNGIEGQPTPSSGGNLGDNKLLLGNWYFSLGLFLSCFIIVVLLYLLYQKRRKREFSYTPLLDS